MDDTEIFSQSRVERCMAIQRSIMDNWQKTNQFQYTVRATEKVEGLTLTELRKQYFAVGVGDKLTEVPFHDMLVVFSMIEQEWAALKNHVGSDATEFTINYAFTTAFHDEEAVRLLSAIQIQTPFDKGKRLRVVEHREPIDPQDDDPKLG